MSKQLTRLIPILLIVILLGVFLPRDIGVTITSGGWLSLTLETARVYADPGYEDFTTYTKSGIRYASGSPNATECHVEDVRRGDNNEWLYKDKGSGHFSGDFEHLMDTKLDLKDNWGDGFLWALSNYIGDGQDHIDASQNWIVVFWFGTSPRMYLQEYYNSGGSTKNDFTTSVIDQTWYYLKIKRVSSTLYCYIATSAANRESETWLDTLSISLENIGSYQYIYAYMGENSASFPTLGIDDMWTRNLDLQEGACAEDITNTPNSNAFGILEVNTNSTTAIDYFTITNNSGGAVSVTIQATDFTGGDDTWDLSDTATPGENIYGLEAGLDDDDDNFDVIVKETVTYNTLVSGLADSATQDWGLKLHMPTSITDYDMQEMSATVTLVASCD